MPPVPSQLANRLNNNRGAGDFSQDPSSSGLNRRDRAPSIFRKRSIHDVYHVELSGTLAKLSKAFGAVVSSQGKDWDFADPPLPLPGRFEDDRLFLNR